ncbi:MAG TPA: Xaa-Pro aminopeptidase [Candidatus Saccharimonadales bacterium]|nr:Xaa-Pro aminopeptidase [Candidatus Saccharimonadales bacterium]
MSGIFTSDFFIHNRRRLREQVAADTPIVITANGLLQKASDEAFAFHQDRSFWYLTGVDEPDILLVIDKDEEYLIVPGREFVREKFDGAVDVSGLTRRSGITKILDEKGGWDHLGATLKENKHIGTLIASPKYVDFWGMYTNPARAELIKKLKMINSKIKLLDIRLLVARMRMIKQKPELEAIQQAIDITNQTLNAVIEPTQLAKYTNEYQVEADITHGFRWRGASGHGFSPIVASGKRGCTLHSVTNDGDLTKGDLITIDVGAEVDHYTADITRTVSFNGQPSKRQQAVYEAVLEAQEYAFSLLKPGVLIKDYEKLMEIFIGKQLRELKVIKTLKRDAIRNFFPHATSHFLGLDAHDAGDYEQPLAPGVVLAVEPGIYIPEESIGVRIEDNVVITKTGNKVLSRELARALL